MEQTKTEANVQNKGGKRLKGPEAKLEYKTERWMYLTELAEKIEAQKK